MVAYSASPIDDNAALADRVMGKSSAPVTIIEYSSLTCPHCAEFNEKTLPQLKADYIDTGKVKWISRDFPLDAIGLKAAELARCVPAERYFPIVDLLFKGQGSWAHATDPVGAITPLAKFAGLNDAEIQACLADKTLEDGIIAERQTAEKTYKVDSTPTFIFNDGAETISGSQSYDKFKETIDKLLKK